MRSIIAKADQLALIGSPMEHEDLLEIIAAGLTEEFSPVIDMVNGRDTPIGIPELLEKLLNQENNILITESLPPHSLPTMANTAQYRSPSSAT